jgi:chromosome segregation ATPase
MMLESVLERPTEGESSMSEKVLLKRSIIVKSQVTDEFRQKASQELGEETKTIESQLAQLESQYQQSLRQLEDMARQGQNVSKQMDQLHREVQTRQVQLQNLRNEVKTQLENLDKVQNGDYVVTGQLENYIDVAIGDNLYDKVRGAEILLKDGVVTAILN